MTRPSDRIEARARAMRRSVQAERGRMAGTMRDHAFRLTSGTIPASTLAALGHPFGRGGGRRRVVVRSPRPTASRASGRGTVPLLAINVRSGRLRRSLRTIPIRDGFRIQFTSRSSRYVLAPGGTRTMVARGFWVRMGVLAAAERRRAAERVRRAVANA